MRKTYIVGHYQYREMSRPKIRAEREENLDCLPPTMFICMRWIDAENKKDAIAYFKETSLCTQKNHFKK